MFKREEVLPPEIRNLGQTLREEYNLANNPAEQFSAQNMSKDVIQEKVKRAQVTSLEVEKFFWIVLSIRFRKLSPMWLLSRNRNHLPTEWCLLNVLYRHFYPVGREIQVPEAIHQWLECHLAAGFLAPPLFVPM